MENPLRTEADARSTAARVYGSGLIRAAYSRARAWPRLHHSRRRGVALPALAIILAAAAWLLLCAPQARAQDLKLAPQPRQIDRREGAFLITAKTRIVIHAVHAADDRLAAETLAEEIESATGRRV